MFIYILIWLLGLGFLSFEYWSLDYRPGLSFLLAAQKKGWIADTISLSTDPGRPLSLWLGWFGLGLMVLMNVYSIRKRADWLRGVGSLKAWLNFHVFCGLMGPILIFFHCKLNVRGLVAISFWSMVVSLTSGIIGRYFYVQMLSTKSEFEILLDKIEAKLGRVLQRTNLSVTEPEKEKVLKRALRMAGVDDPENIPSILTAFFSAFVGDLRLSFQTVPIGPKWPEKTRSLVTYYAQTKRKILFWESFQSLMGYWHTFHFPFAIFMYVAAFIHVIAALVLGV